MSAARRTGNHGFTLIELLVVVAIIALLISILLPSLSRAREQARTVACSSLLKQWGTANSMYADASDGYFTPIANWSIRPRSDGRRAWYGNPKLRRMLGLEEGRSTPGQFMCPNTPEQEIHLDHSYSMNSTVGNGTYSETRRGGFHRPSIPNPSGTVQMIDGTHLFVNKPHARYVQFWDVYGDLSPHRGGDRFVAYRHMEGANLQHFDTHVEHYNKEEVFTGDNDTDLQLWRVYAPN